MPSIYQLKPAFQNLLRPLTRGLAAAGVTVNQVTLAALGLSFLAGAVIAWQPLNRPLLLLIPLTLILRMALNAIDGMLAREHDMESRLGAILNELGDVLSDSALYLPLALVPGFNPWLVVSAVVLSVIVEMTGVVAVQIGAARNYAGPMGKSDRAFVFGLITLLLGLNISPGPWVTLLLGAMVLLSAFTIYNRARRSLAEGAE
jgi:CDP-diacylglycerol---glycerol-3-phosphate 3-phosphatidyltransferase